MTHLVDFHCHLDLYSDYERVLAESEAAEVYTLAVTTTPRAWKRNFELTKGLQYIRPALGLHPQLVGKGTTSELELWEDLLSQAKYVGEVGIDGSPAFAHTLEEQKRVFTRILVLCAKQGGKILSVHAVRSISIVLDLLEAHFSTGSGVVVLHWFSGTVAQAQRAVELGCYFSINSAMVGSKNGQVIVGTLPTERMLVETDGPFVEIEGKPARPKDAAYTTKAIGGLLGITTEEAAAMIASNLKRVVVR